MLKILSAPRTRAIRGGKDQVTDALELVPGDSIWLAACAVIFVAWLTNGIPAMEIFMTVVSLAVFAIPGGLPAIVTILL